MWYHLCLGEASAFVFFEILNPGSSKGSSVFWTIIISTYPHSKKAQQKSPEAAGVRSWLCRVSLLSHSVTFKAVNLPQYLRRTSSECKLPKNRQISSNRCILQLRVFIRTTYKMKTVVSRRDLVFNINRFRLNSHTS